ncbi:hypothetical protein KKC1_16390 [Calderihabitans maritimus]|uniref:Uncharacterized protein n=1 Tax=Calderihabitans maritimus TaxID=1246530 RepID=A0A1Z5HT52_9FIRM|nr:hypothetical protein KKC1_16390 [Calderihabitans maritimus]
MSMSGYCMKIRLLYHGPKFPAVSVRPAFTNRDHQLAMGQKAGL